jgi:hypothetical protein
MLEKLKQKLAQTAQTVVDNIKLPEEQRNQRLEICKTCDQFHSTDFCKLCGCYMPVKTYIPSVSCPQKKWLPIAVVNSDKTENLD